MAVGWTADSYTVTLHPSGGTIAQGKDVTAYTYGVGATLPTAADVTRDLYTFAGWYDNEAFTGNAVAAITPTDAGNKEYWAKWNLIPGDPPRIHRAGRPEGSDRAARRARPRCPLPPRVRPSASGT